MKGRSWFATPILLTIAASPMLRATAIPGHEAISLLGLVVLLGLALKAFKDRVTTRDRQGVTSQVRREIPFMVSGNVRAVSGGVRAVSGSHPKL